MHALERIGIAIRHSRWLERADGLWDAVRPMYESLISLMYRNGILRVINGSDAIRLLPRYRGITEVYEPDVWRHLMQCVQPGDVVADVGAYVGLYTLALSQRVRPGGKVMAFEPDPTSFEGLSRHVALNGVVDTVELCQAVVGCEDGSVAFAAGRGSESHVAAGDGGFAEPLMVRVVRLDSVLRDERLDVLKIDVEGYEELVLQGARELLSDPLRKPRAIYIEVHPYAWSGPGTTSESLLSLLQENAYAAYFLTGEPVDKIDRYGEIIAVGRSSFNVDNREPS
jgi:FkbM family methyltransferase